MDAFEAVATKLDVREFSDRPVPTEVKRRVLEAARLTGSGVNSQHWSFVLVQDKENLKKLSKDSTSGAWVSSANFAVIVLTNPKYNFHLLDAGRALQDMEVAAWNQGVASGIYTGFDKTAMVRDFAVPPGLNIAVVVAFGFPTKKLAGRKRRKQLSEVAYSEAYGHKLAL